MKSQWKPLGEQILKSVVRHHCLGVWASIKKEDTLRLSSGVPPQCQRPLCKQIGFNSEQDKHDLNKNVDSVDK